MLQAEIGSAKITAPDRFPTRGHLMSDFTLPSTEGREVSLYDYRGRSNLVLLFAAHPEESAEATLLSGLIQHHEEINDQDSQVLLVLPGPGERAAQFQHQMHLPFPVLTDEDMHVHNSVGASGAQAVPAPALYVTDRFMEVYGAWRTGTGDSLPGVAEVLSWLAYIDSQCPECSQAEWPQEE